MNIKDLNQIKVEDLKNVDLSLIKENLLSRPHYIINVVLVVATIAGSIHLYQRNQSETAQIKKEIVKLKDRLSAVKKQKKLEEQHKEFTADFPKIISVDDLGDKLSEFAVLHNVQIVTFSPGGSKNDNFKTINNVEINIASDDYENIILFIKEIENSSFAVRIQKWSGKMSKGQSRRGSSSAQNRSIEANIIINSIELTP